MTTAESYTEKSSGLVPIKHQLGSTSKTTTLSLSSTSQSELSTTTPNAAAATTATNAATIVTKGHKFEVVTFTNIERCEYCCAILYGMCRQAVRCKEKSCNYLCHPKCRQFLPANCPININQRVQLKGVDFTRGIGTLMQGTLKV